MSSREAEAFLREQCQIHPVMAVHFDELGSLYQGRLWSQLSNKLADICRTEFFQKDKHLIRLYENFVKKFEKHLNPLHMAMFALDVSKQYGDAPSSLGYLEGVCKGFEAKITLQKPSVAAAAAAKDKDGAAAKDKPKGDKDKAKPSDKDKAAGPSSTAGKDKAKDFKDTVMTDAKGSGDSKSKSAADSSKKDSNTADADKDGGEGKGGDVLDRAQATAESAPYVQAAALVKTEIVRRKCDLHRMDEAKEVLDDVRSSIDGFMGIMEQVVHSHYYLAAFQYFKLKFAAAEYFRHALLYLTYTPLPTISQREQHTLAADVGMSALLGEDTYNFGELLQHSILKVLDHTPQAWIAALLHAFSAGDIPKFKQIFAEISPKEAMLKKNAEFLNQKVRIMALMDMIFRRGARSRTLTFAEIAKTCDLAAEQVEFMLMKAFALRVITGSIDEIDKTVHIKWVQPRVLHMQQISHIRDRLRQWSKDVQNTASYLQENAPSLLGGATTDG